MINMDKTLTVCTLGVAGGANAVTLEEKKLSSDSGQHYKPEHNLFLQTNHSFRS